MLTTRQVAAMHGYSVARANALATKRGLGTKIGTGARAPRLFTPKQAREMKPGPPGNPRNRTRSG